VTVKSKKIADPNTTLHIYTRVSSLAQANDGTSLGTQNQLGVAKAKQLKFIPQKWDEGGFAAPHSDNSDYDGVPNAFEINKYVGILYLNDNYEGGELYFCNEKEDFDEETNNDRWDTYLSFKPNNLSYYIFPGGVENVHGVSEILKGTRYTMVSFWDYAEIEYDQATLDKWEEEEKEVRRQQALQKEEWLKGNKYA
jgi:hypothetical protein